MPTRVLARPNSVVLAPSSRRWRLGLEQTISDGDWPRWTNPCRAVARPAGHRAGRDGLASGVDLAGGRRYPVGPPAGRN